MGALALGVGDPAAALVGSKVGALNVLMRRSACVGMSPKSYTLVCVCSRGCLSVYFFSLHVSSFPHASSSSSSSSSIPCDCFFSLLVHIHQLGHIRVYGKKTLEGTAAFALVSLVIFWFYMSNFYQVSTGALLQIGTVGAISGACTFLSFVFFASIIMTRPSFSLFFISFPISCLFSSPFSLFWVFLLLPLMPISLGLVCLCFFVSFRRDCRALLPGACN